MHCSSDLKCVHSRQMPKDDNSESLLKEVKNMAGWCMIQIYGLDMSAHAWGLLLDCIKRKIWKEREK